MKHQIKKGDFILDVVVTQEKVGDKTFFVAQGIQIDVASQGLSLEEALENIREASEIVIESSKDKHILEKECPTPMLTRVLI